MHFLAEYISAHRGCWAPKILHALEIDQALIAHTRSGTRLRNDSRYPKSERNVIDSASSRIPWKKSRELWFTNKKKCYWLELSHLSGFFGGDYISALRGCCPIKFSYALEIPAHPNGDASPPKKRNFLSWKFKIWPKIQRISPHFGAGGGILTTRRVINFGPQTKTL